MSASAIEWTDEVWNPVTGCDRVSPGCAHCYALELAPRLRAMGNAKYQRARDGGPASGPAFGVTLHPDVLDAPLRWRRPRRVFVNSMSDLFHDEIPDEFISHVFDVMAQAKQHTFQVLTKRPERMRDVLNARFGAYAAQFDRLPPSTDRRGWNGATSDSPAAEWARDRSRNGVPNVWLGVSIENRRYAHRADVLRDTPAAVRFISAEPLLGPLRADGEPMAAFDLLPMWADGEFADADSVLPQLDLDGIDWLIVGGESGPRRRPMRPEWVRDLRDHADAAGTAFFFKQWGGRTPKAGGRELDGRTWDEMPTTVPAAAVR